ncbi:beta family protein [Vibrio alginolyticus]|uniref:beta family protein n=1 Tax=Vibrio alginolyticus TaxID=663 RepID=UPI00215C34E6|nr:beta family protein [Vibrio alginolyticus]MCR9526532.1 beta family protein [Vibrio alginolyticus]
MSSSCYYPILKTTVSEMRALKQFNCTDGSVIHPILELTKARKSKYDEIGDVYKRVQEISDIVENNYFYLDLTSEDSLSNSQIESYFDDFNNFENWRSFIESLVNEGLAVRPIIQAFDDSSIEEIQSQMLYFSELCGTFAIRLKPEYLDMDISIKLIQAAQKFDFTTILDAEYVDSENISYSKSIYSSFIQQCESDKLKLGTTIVCSSSFPAMVNHGNKDAGEFSLHEKQFYSELVALFPYLDLKYGDYASVHPFRNDVTAYNWVPRIDYPTIDKVVFCRKQRNLGGYKDCANRMVVNKTYKANPINCWGNQEILDACSKPNGKSPSYWISVRINIHMTRSVLWLK